MHPALPIAAASVPLQAFNLSQIARRKPGRTSSGAALEQLGEAFDKRVADIAPGRNPVLGLGLNEPQGNIIDVLKEGTSKYASNQDVTGQPNSFNIRINPNADRSYFAHELGHVASAQTDIGRFVRSATTNKNLSRALGSAALLAAGGTAVATAGDDDLGTSVALAYAASLPTIADEFLASKNALAIMDTAGMRASLGQRGRLAGGLMSYAAAPLLAGASANLVGNQFDDPSQTEGTIMP